MSILGYNEYISVKIKRCDLMALLSVVLTSQDKDFIFNFLDDNMNLYRKGGQQDV